MGGFDPLPEAAWEAENCAGSERVVAVNELNSADSGRDGTADSRTFGEFHHEQRGGALTQSEGSHPKKDRGSLLVDDLSHLGLLWLAPTLSLLGEMPLLSETRSSS